MVTRERSNLYHTLSFELYHCRCFRDVIDRVFRNSLCLGGETLRHEAVRCLQTSRHGRRGFDDLGPPSKAPFWRLHRARGSGGQGLPRLCDKRAVIVTLMNEIIEIGKVRITTRLWSFFFPTLFSLQRDNRLWSRGSSSLLPPLPVLALIFFT